MNVPVVDSLRGPERLLLEPWQSALRFFFGFGVLDVATRCRVTVAMSFWQLCALLLAALLALRVACLLVRNLLPFSSRLKDAWFDQRQLAKRFDSYQWAKLLWIGLGMATYVAYLGRLPSKEAALALVCIVAGAVGTLCWRRAQTATRRTSSG